MIKWVNHVAEKNTFVGGTSNIDDGGNIWFTKVWRYNAWYWGKLFHNGFQVFGRGGGGIYILDCGTHEFKKFNRMGFTHKVQEETQSMYGVKSCSEGWDSREWPDLGNSTKRSK